jgi:hypothetical protein
LVLRAAWPASTDHLQWVKPRPTNQTTFTGQCISKTKEIGGVLIAPQPHISNLVITTQRFQPNTWRSTKTTTFLEKKSMGCHLQWQRKRTASHPQIQALSTGIVGGG